MFSRLFRRLGLAAGFCLLMTAPAYTAPGIVIWKFDDLMTGPRGNINPMIKRVVAWATQNKMPISFGIITKTLSTATPEDIAWIKQNARENGGWVEFWHHGWTHTTVVDSRGTTIAWEFKNSTLDEQIASLSKGCAEMTKATGLTLCTFGAPNNAIDRTTIAALDAVPQLRIWFYGDQQDQGRLVIKRTLNLEIAVGTIDEEAFLKHYHQQTGTVLALQAHPPMWSESSFTAFTSLAQKLTADGWKSMTPSEYAATIVTSPTPTVSSANRVNWLGRSSQTAATSD